MFSAKCWFYANMSKELFHTKVHNLIIFHQNFLFTVAMDYVRHGKIQGQWSLNRPRSSPVFHHVWHPAVTYAASQHQGRLFWIVCKRPAFLSCFSRLKTIQNLAPSAAGMRQCDIRIANKLEQLEFKLKKLLELRNTLEKLENWISIKMIMCSFIRQTFFTKTEIIWPIEKCDKSESLPERYVIQHLI